MKRVAAIPFWQMLKLSLGLAVLAMCLAFGLDFQWTALGNLGWWSVPLSVVIATVLFVVFVWLVSHRWLRLRSFYSLTADLHVMLKDLTWAQIIVLSFLAGIGEELLFRGVMQAWLSETSGVYSAIVISSLVFALLHALTRYYFVFALGLSLLFGVLFAMTQSMVLLILVHAVYDVIAIVVIAKYPHVLGLTQDRERYLKM